MIAKKPKKLTLKQGQGYQRSKFQKTNEDNLPLDDKERAYAKSALDAPPIEYPATGNLI